MKTLLRLAATIFYLAHFYFGLIIAGLLIPSFPIADAADAEHIGRALGAALVALFGFALLIYVSAELGARVFGRYDSSRAALPKHHVMLALVFPVPIVVVGLVLGSEYTGIPWDFPRSLVFDQLVDGWHVPASSLLPMTLLCCAVTASGLCTARSPRRVTPRPGVSYGDRPHRARCYMLRCV